MIQSMCTLESVSVTTRRGSDDPMIKELNVIWHRERISEKWDGSPAEMRREMMCGYMSATGHSGFITSVRPDLCPAIWALRDPWVPFCSSPNVFWNP